MLEDADCVIHCSTVGRTSGETNGVNVLYPEIEGMMNLLDCCEKKNIMRFILVGCISNVMTGKYWNNFNESHWANPDICDIYERAKFFVEKCAWNYYEHNKKNFKLTVFLPGLLIGPLKKRGERSTNVIFFKRCFFVRSFRKTHINDSVFWICNKIHNFIFRDMQFIYNKTTWIILEIFPCKKSSYRN